MQVNRQHRHWLHWNFDTAIVSLADVCVITATLININRPSFKIASVNLFAENVVVHFFSIICMQQSCNNTHMHVNAILMTVKWQILNYLFEWVLKAACKWRILLKTTALFSLNDMFQQKLQSYSERTTHFESTITPCYWSKIISLILTLSHFASFSCYYSLN